MVGVSIGDIISLAQVAAGICDTYRKSPERYRSISSDVNNLAMVLRRVGEASQRSRMTAEQEKDLQSLIDQAKSTLEELKKRLQEVKVLETASRLSWERLRWDSKDFDSMRQRVTTICNLLSALNTGILLSLFGTEDDQ